jgi:rubrerythrin
MADEQQPDDAQRGERSPEDWTADERRSFRLAVDARRARQLRAGQWFAGVLMAIVAVAVGFRVPPAWWVPVVGAAALLGMAFRLVNWKCPNCGERLPTRRSPERCPGCGAPLD